MILSRSELIRKMNESLLTANEVDLMKCYFLLYPDKTIQIYRIDRPSFEIKDRHKEDTWRPG